MNDRIRSALAVLNRGYAVLAVILGLSLVASIYEATHHRKAPGSPVEARFAALGRANSPRVLASHAFAYHRAADSIRAKKPIADVIASIPADYASNLAEAGRRSLVPELVKILPPGTPDDGITDKQRADLADAFDGYALGLTGKYP